MRIAKSFYSTKLDNQLTSIHSSQDAEQKMAPANLSCRICICESDRDAWVCDDQTDDNISVAKCVAVQAVDAARHCPVCTAARYPVRT